MSQSRQPLFSVARTVPKADVKLRDEVSGSLLPHTVLKRDVVIVLVTALIVALGFLIIFWTNSKTGWIDSFSVIIAGKVIRNF